MEFDVNKVLRWLDNLVQYEDLSYGGARTVGDIKREIKNCIITRATSNGNAATEAGHGGEGSHNTGSPKLLDAYSELEVWAIENHSNNEHCYYCKDGKGKVLKQDIGLMCCPNCKREL